MLENDGDPDGDVVGLVGHTADDGLTVKEVEPASATSSPSPPTRRRARRSATRSPTARSDPVSAVVVVAVTDSVVVNQPPVARADVVEVRAGGKVAVPVIANDYDPEGGALKVVSVTPFDGAETAPGLNGQTADVRVGPDVVSSFTLSYTVADDAGNQSSAFLEVRIVPADEVNRPPIARTDLARTRSGVPVAIEVVANDTDPDGDIIAAENIRTQPTGGVARVEAGVVVYTPGDTFTGTDRFTYALVDAGGEIAIGEVLVGVMPLSGANRAPEAFDDAVEAVAGSAPLVFDVLDNDSDPDGDRILVTEAGAPSSGATEVADGGGAVMFTPPAQITPGPTGAAGGGVHVLRSTTGAGGTASATVTVRVITATEAIAPIAVDDQIGPLTPGVDGRGRPARSTTSTRRQPGRARRRLRRPGAGHPRRRRRDVHRRADVEPPRVHDHRPGRARPTPPSWPCSSCPTGRRSSSRTSVQTPANEPITIDLAGQADRSRRRHAVLRLLRRPAGRRGHDRHQRRRRAHRVVRPERRLRRAGHVLLHRRRPAGPHRRRGRDDRRAAAEQPAADVADDTTLTVEAGITDEHRPGGARHRSRPRRHADVHDHRPRRGRRAAGLDGATCRRRRGSTRPSAPTRSSTPSPTAPGSRRTGTVSLTITAAVGAAAAGPGRTRRRRTRARP